MCCAGQGLSLSGAHVVRFSGLHRDPCMSPVKPCPKEFLLENPRNMANGFFPVVKRQKTNMLVLRPSHEHSPEGQNNLQRCRHQGMLCFVPRRVETWKGSGFNTSGSWQCGAMAASPCLLVLAVKVARFMRAAVGWPDLPGSQ